MKVYRRRLRAAALLTLPWILAWAIGSATFFTWRQGPYVADGPVELIWFFVTNAVAGGTFGAICGALFTALLARAEQRRSVEELRYARVALWGGVMGAAFPLAIHVAGAASGHAALGGPPLVFIGISSLVGLAVATGILWAARSAAAT